LWSYLHIINPLRGCGVNSTLLIPVRGRGVCSLVNREILLQLRSELRSDALLATTIDFSGIRTHKSLHASCVFWPLRHGRSLLLIPVNLVIYFRLWDVATYANLFALLLMSMDHFMAVRFSIRHALIMTQKAIKVAIGISWLTAAILGLQEVISWAWHHIIINVECIPNNTLCFELQGFKLMTAELNVFVRFCPDTLSFRIFSESEL